MIEEIRIVEGYGHKEEILSLFKEYTEMLIGLNGSYREYLKVQHYDDEIEELEKKYAKPRGRLYLAKTGDESAACIAVRPLTEKRCELKRLFVRPCFRGNHIASRLIDLVLKEAKEEGYEELLLDTVPELEAAIHLYKAKGFEETDCYNDSPPELPTLFFRRVL